MRHQISPASPLFERGHPDMSQSFHSYKHFLCFIRCHEFTLVCLQSLLWPFQCLCQPYLLFPALLLHIMLKLKILSLSLKCQKVKNAHKCFQKPKEMSLNYLFCGSMSPKCRDIQLIVYNPDRKIERK